MLRYPDSQSSALIVLVRRDLVYIRINMQTVLRPKPSMSVAYSPFRNEDGTTGAVEDIVGQISSSCETKQMEKNATDDCHDKKLRITQEM